MVRFWGGRGSIDWEALVSLCPFFSDQLNAGQKQVGWAVFLPTIKADHGGQTRLPTLRVIACLVFCANSCLFKLIVYAGSCGMWEREWGVFLLSLV